MKAYRLLTILSLCLILGVGTAACLWVYRDDRERSGEYRVEAKRLADEIEDTGSYDLGRYPSLTGVFPDEGDGRLYQSEEAYVVISAGGRLYRVEYSVQDNTMRSVGIVALLTGISAGIMTILLVYIRRHIIMPFQRLVKVPEELAKGDLAEPLREEKSRFFGKFTWAVNLLRESIEDTRRREIAYQRDKKLLLLSLSHDIKTPLSAIKLNAKALERGLYTQEEKRRAAARSINARADEIESYLEQMTEAASNDLMRFEINMGEEFLAPVVERLQKRYAMQLETRGTRFVIGKFRNCLLSCDPDRLAECLQNLMENAIKYGDGRRIELSFDQMDGCQLITVSNSGCTIAPSELTQIFSSFHRGSNSENVPGSGLGLFICRKLMSGMNGDVFADIKDGDFSATLVVRLA